MRTRAPGRAWPNKSVVTRELANSRKTALERRRSRAYALARITKATMLEAMPRVMLSTTIQDPSGLGVGVEALLRCTNTEEVEEFWSCMASIAEVRWLC